jgi:hypothetical protein
MSTEGAFGSSGSQKPSKPPRPRSWVIGSIEVIANNQHRRGRPKKETP